MSDLDSERVIDAAVITSPDGRVYAVEIVEKDMTPEQSAAYDRDVPAGCPCDYIWTGLVWTRSSATSYCDLHGSENQP